MDNSWPLSLPDDADPELPKPGMLAHAAVNAARLTTVFAAKRRIFMASRYSTIRVHGDNPCTRCRTRSGARPSGRSTAKAAVTRDRGRAHQGAREIARGKSRGRFGRSRRHDLSAAQLC